MSCSSPSAALLSFYLAAICMSTESAAQPKPTSDASQCEASSNEAAPGSNQARNPPADFLIQEHNRFTGEIYTVTCMRDQHDQFRVLGAKPIRYSLIKFGIQFDHRNPRLLCDHEQQLLFYRRQNQGAVVQLLRESGETAITFRRKSLTPFLGVTIMLAWRGEERGPHHMEVHSDMFRVDYRFQMKEVGSSRVVATVRRQGIDGERSLGDWRSFVLRVEDGEDTALMSLFAITLVEEFHGDV